MSEEKKVVSISSKITGVAVSEKKETVEVHEVAPMKVLERLNEKMKRPEALQGRTYKIKPSILNHALYLTINDIVLNEGTEHESRQPFEIFINSKEMESYQWVVAMTRLISAVWRKGGDATFMLEELKSVFDPNGGYFSPKAHGRMPSLVAEIGYAIEEHFKWLGLIKTEATVVAPEVKEFIEQRKEDFLQMGGSMDAATVCSKCGEKSVIVIDRCPTCTSCGDSKCG